MCVHSVNQKAQSPEEHMFNNAWGPETRPYIDGDGLDDWIVKTNTNQYAHKRKTYTQKKKTTHTRT